MHAGVVGCDEDQSALDSGVCGGEQRVGRDIDADVFHRDERARTGKSGAKPDLQGHLLVWRPAGDYVVARVSGEGFKYFGTGRAGIPGSHLHADVRRGKCDGFVSGKKHSGCLRQRSHPHVAALKASKGRLRQHCAAGARPFLLKGGVRRYFDSAFGLTPPKQ